MRTWWWASDDGRARAAADGADVAPSRAAFFGESDIVSVHIRLTGATSHVVTRADLAAMRSDAVFVNTSRAGLVEPGALEEALLAGRPGHAAVDVYEVEPLVDADQPFIQHPNLVATPHIGYVTEDEWDLQFTDIYEQINAYRDGRPINVVNPEALRDE
jgi:D-3-phosphoglycerate dehydrogenase